MIGKIKQGYKNLRNYLLDPDIDVRERLFVASSIFALIGIAIAAICGLAFGENTEAVVACIYAFVLFSAMIFIGYRLRRLYSVAVIVCALIVFVFLPASFYTSGGIYGGTPVWAVFIALYIGMIQRGRIRVFFYLAELAIVGACWYAQYNDPTIVVEHTRNAAFGDIFGSMFVVGIVLSVIVSFQASLYSNENKRVQRQKQRIEELNMAQSRFFSSMSHEIRTPINTIIGLNEMILRENTSAEINEDAENIRAASNMLLHLVNDILDLSKLESKSMQLDIHPYKTGDMLSGIVGMFWHSAVEKGLDFHVEISPDIPMILEGDEFRIEQILVNIINNAIKYTQSGSVTLSVQMEKTSGGNANVIYSVSDTGMGIRKESIPYLFDVFKRVDDDNNKRIEGTGLGLSIVRQFVDLMGGTITVNSIYTKGSTFIVEIPQRIIDANAIEDIIIEKRRDPNRRSSYRQSLEAPDAKVLVVDDTEANLMVVEKLLRETRVQVTVARSGAEALRYTLDNKFDVIFMDHLMPSMDGIECAKRIRTQTGGMSRDAAIEVLTANAGAESAALYEREGFDGYLVKPIEGKSLERELIRLLPSRLVTLTGDDEQIIEESMAWHRSKRTKTKVEITTESVADLPPSYIKEHDIGIIPYRVRTETGIFKDGRDIQTRGAIAYIESGRRIKSLPPETEEYERFFANRLESTNNVIHIALSSEIPCSGCEAAGDAAKSFENVFVVDSDHVSGGMALMLMEARRLANDGEEVEEIIRKLEILKYRISTSFVVDSIDYLVDQYRTRAFWTMTAQAFMIRPMLRISDGKLAVWGSGFGSMANAVKKYIRETLFAPSGIDRKLLLVVYTGLEKEELDWIRSLVDKRAVFDNVIFTMASPAIVASYGPKAFGLFFVRK